MRNCRVSSDVLSEKDKAALSALVQAAALPAAYDFEIEKTICRIRRENSRRVALQLPEGLMRYACSLSLIIESSTRADVIILADVTYGACCVDDTTVGLLGCDLLIHYGHSCLIPIDRMDSSNHGKLKILYVFVRIKIDADQVASCIVDNFQISSRLALVSTVQFVSSLVGIRNRLREHGIEIIIPQCRPLSPGEILGCTAPNLTESVDGIVYVGDGRFHLEAMMIANPQVPEVYRFDPYMHRLTRERYENGRMISRRLNCVEVAKREQTWVIVVGTLGRQGSHHSLESLLNAIKERESMRFVKVAMSELNTALLERLFEHVRVFVHISCPRLSIDWCSSHTEESSEGGAHPVFLNGYEAMIALGKAESDGVHYPMNYYFLEANRRKSAARQSS